MSTPVHHVASASSVDQVTCCTSNRRRTIVGARNAKQTQTSIRFSATLATTASHTSMHGRCTSKAWDTAAQLAHWTMERKMTIRTRSTVLLATSAASGKVSWQITKIQQGIDDALTMYYALTMMTSFGASLASSAFNWDGKWIIINRLSAIDIGLNKAKIRQEHEPIAACVISLRRVSMLASARSRAITPLQRAKRNDVAHCGAFLVDLQVVGMEPNHAEGRALAREFRRIYGTSHKDAVKASTEGSPEFGVLMDMLAAVKLSRR